MTSKINHTCVIVCGSRDWQDGERIFADLNKVKDTSIKVTLLEGGAIGADAFAGEWGRRNYHSTRYNITEVVAWVPVLAKWHDTGRSAGPLRNEEMINMMIRLGADRMLLLAYPMGKSVGTKNMIGLARRAGIETIVRELPSEGSEDVAQLSIF